MVQYYQTVQTKTREVHEQCDTLLREQKELEGVADEVCSLPHSTHTTRLYFRANVVQTPYDLRIRKRSVAEARAPRSSRPSSRTSTSSTGSARSSAAPRSV